MTAYSYTDLQTALRDWAMALAGDGGFLFALGYDFMPKNLNDRRGVAGGGAAVVLDGPESADSSAPLVQLPAIACYHTGDGPAQRDTDGATWQSVLTSVVLVDWEDAYAADRMLNERLWALREASEADFTLGGRVMAASITTLRREPRITSISGYLTRTAEVVWAITTGVSTG